MSIQNELLNTTPCVGPATCLLQYRSIYGQLGNTNGTLAGSDNMIAYITAAFNNALTGADAVNNINTLAWSETRNIRFNTYADTTPTGGVFIDQDGGNALSRTEFYTSTEFLIISPTSNIIVSQVWLGAARPYMVLALGFGLEDIGGKTIIVEGCTFTPATSSVCGAGLLVNLPIPNVNLGNYCQQYIFSLVGTGGYPNLTAFGAAEASGGNAIYGPNWNAYQVCALGNEDPFTPVPPGS